MRFEKSLSLQARAAKNDSRVKFAPGHQFRVPEVEVAQDKEGVYTRPRRRQTLLERLLARSKGGAA